MKRTKLAHRTLPNYTRGEEIMNMVTHIVGGVFGVVALILCIISAVKSRSVWGVVTGSIYGFSLIALYTVSSVYHGLFPNLGKKVMQVVDHCTIYFLIAGTYTPILLVSLRQVNPTLAWIIFAVVWGLAIFAATLTAIDLNKYKKLSMACYIGIGWCIIFAVKPTIQAISLNGFILLLLGGVAYTVGAVIYGAGKKIKYMHGVFHLFVLLGSILHFLCIILYVL